MKFEEPQYLRRELQLKPLLQWQYTQYMSSCAISHVNTCSFPDSTFSPGMPVEIEIGGSLHVCACTWPDKVLCKNPSPSRTSYALLRFFDCCTNVIPLGLGPTAAAVPQQATSCCDCPSSSTLQGPQYLDSSATGRAPHSRHQHVYAARTQAHGPFESQ